MISKITLLLSLGLLALPLARAESDIDAVRRADDARVAAIIARDPVKMAAIFSDDLTYSHSTGLVNHKADYIANTSTGPLRYLSIDYENRQFRSAAPGVVLGIGRCRVHVVNNGKEEHIRLSFLMVYRRESGVWRFLAWQSCKLTSASPPFPN